MHVSKKSLAFSVIIVYLVFHFDLLCALRQGELRVESSGKHVSYIAVVTSCKSKIHGMTKPGIHVIGLGKMKVESIHVGIIEDFNRIEKLKEIESSLKAMSSRFRYVGITTNGGTHNKPALTRLRDDVALEALSPSITEFSLVKFFKKYDMGKFLSVQHGCCKPYIMVYDTRLGKKLVEITGKLDGKIKHVINV